MFDEELVTDVQNGLRECLLDFQQRFNANSRVKKLILHWDRQILVEAADTGNLQTLVVADGALVSVEPGLPTSADDEDLIHMQGDDAVLTEIFSGRCNPSTALIDGMLSVFSNEKDKVKLEALAMVIWN